MPASAGDAPAPVVRRRSHILRRDRGAVACPVDQDRVDLVGLQAAGHRFPLSDRVPSQWSATAGTSRMSASEPSVIGAYHAAR